MGVSEKINKNLLGWCIPFKYNAQYTLMQSRYIFLYANGQCIQLFNVKKYFMYCYYITICWNAAFHVYKKMWQNISFIINKNAMH